MGRDVRGITQVLLTLFIALVAVCGQAAERFDPIGPPIHFEPQPPIVGQTLTFKVEVPEEGHTFSWDFGDGTPIESGGHVATHSYDQAGEYRVTVEITNPRDEVFKTFIGLRVNNEGEVNYPPVVDSMLDAQPNPAQVGDVVEFSVSASDPEGGDLNYFWDFGDGSPPVHDAAATVSHTYTADGFYGVRVVIRDAGDAVWGRVSDWYLEYAELRYCRNISAERIAHLRNQADRLRHAL